MFYHNVTHEYLRTSSLLLVILKKAFPKIWEQKIRNNNDNRNETDFSNDMFQISNGNTINLSHMKAKHFYNALDDSENSNPSIATLWQDVFKS